jgi:DNA helicase-2/ATP-dependent DNA helicase PcrA
METGAGDETFPDENAPSNPEEMYIRLYTFHGSKGLEFERVIILNVNEGITPSKKASTSEELQEERRMFYVAMTRAKDHLHLFSIQRRRNEILYPSAYLKDLTCPQAGPESRQNA